MAACSNFVLDGRPGTSLCRPVWNDGPPMLLRRLALMIPTVSMYIPPFSRAAVQTIERASVRPSSSIRRQLDKSVSLELNHSKGYVRGFGSKTLTVRDLDGLASARETEHLGNARQHDVLRQLCEIVLNFGKAPVLPSTIILFR